MSLERRKWVPAPLSVPAADPVTANITIPPGATGVTFGISDSSLALSVRPDGVANAITFTNAVEFMGQHFDTAGEIKLAVWHNGVGAKAGWFAYWTE